MYRLTNQHPKIFLKKGRYMYNLGEAIFTVKQKKRKK